MCETQIHLLSVIFLEIVIVCFFLCQPPSSILAQVQLLNQVPIHTISFNCADTEANQFLCQLAAETGGRQVMFLTVYPEEGPRGPEVDPTPKHFSL